MESEAGKGSTFAFYVSARRSTAPPDTDGGTGMKVGPPATARKTSVMANGGSSPEPAVHSKVLIVEDNLGEYCRTSAPHMSETC